MIWIERRSRRISLRFIARTSRFSKMISPFVAGRSRKSSRPIVVLPEPDSPTNPSVSPSSIRKLTPFDRAHVGDVARHQPGVDREST